MAENDSNNNSNNDPIIKAPAPWKDCRGTVYILSFWLSPAKTRKEGLPLDLAYSPLEAASDFASPTAPGNGRPVGGLSQIQLVRYTSTPAGPYDELIIAPGSHEYFVEEGDDKRVKKKSIRITRIYVSQKHTCWNGRTNWNVPKHLAAFQWTDNADGSTIVKVFPHDHITGGATTSLSDPAEASPSSPDTPFFQATIKPVRFVPSFPLSLSWMKYMGVNAVLAQPPLPANPAASRGELPGTDRWCAYDVEEWTRRASLTWFDLKQGDKAGPGGVEEGRENFWPGLGRWHLGVKMEDAVIGLPEGKHWDAPRSML